MQSQMRQWMLIESVFVRGEFISDVDGELRPTNLYRNPSRQEFQAIMKRSFEGGLRGFVYENRDIIVWDGYVADHAGADTLLGEHGFQEWGIRLGFYAKAPNTVYYYLEDIKNARQSGEPDFDDSWVRDNPNITRILGPGYEITGD